MSEVSVHSENANDDVYISKQVVKEIKNILSKDE